MARKPNRGTVLSYVVLLVISGIGAACEAACEAEASALAAADVALEDAETVYSQLLLDFTIDPDPVTAAALAVAEIHRDDIKTVREYLQSSFAECLADGPLPVQPIPLANAPGGIAEQATGHSVLAR